MNYKNTSPYADTNVSSYGNFLDQMVTRNVPVSYNDSVVEITKKYHLRPDLMAYDLYGDANLWWIFAERNPNKLVDPVGDFKSGVFLFVPDKSSVIENLGL